jgi:hypothetical protein
MKTLDVPTVGLSELKRKPTDAFKTAELTNNAVYVFNRGKVVGVLMTSEQFSDLNSLAQNYLNAGYQQNLLARVGDSSNLIDADVRTTASRETPYDSNDGWE